MKIMTLNLNWYEAKHGAWPIRQELIAQVVCDHAPDVIALQAVRKDPTVEEGADQATQLSKTLSEYKHVVFVPGTEHGRGKQDGSGWLSREPFEQLDHQLLPLGSQPGRVQEDPAVRLVLYARVGSISLFNCHFSWVHSQGVQNLDAALPFFRHFPGPQLLIGDFNATPDSDLIGQLSSEGWTDVWANRRPNEPGYTFESQAPDKRIDYVWASREALPAIQAIDVVSAPPNPSHAGLSDHLGLIVTLND